MGMATPQIIKTKSKGILHLKNIFDTAAQQKLPKLSINHLIYGNVWGSSLAVECGSTHGSCWKLGIFGGRN
jgi:hypothetical protein